MDIPYVFFRQNSYTPGKVVADLTAPGDAIGSLHRATALARRDEPDAIWKSEVTWRREHLCNGAGNPSQRGIT